MSWELLALVLIIIAVILLVVFRKNVYVKKCWKYALILTPGVIIIFLRLLLIWKEGKQAAADDKGAKTLASTIGQISKDIKETQLTSAVEVAVAKTKSAETIQKLENIKKISDQDEKIKQLAALVG